MPQFGPQSKTHLETCDKRIIAVAYEVIKHIDYTILWGYRGEAPQNHAFRHGDSTKKWPDSKHNQSPSPAIDVAPWYAKPPHIRWNNVKDFTLLAGYFLGIGDTLGIKLRWGGDWDGDKTTYDQNFHDLGHFELITPENQREEVDRFIATVAEDQRSRGLSRC
jgi:peptidoglycan L-alanyl-D-glutamate endopeptidase CwlK